MTRLRNNITFFVLMLIFGFLAWYAQLMWIGFGTTISLSVATGVTVATLLLGLLAYAFQSYRHQNALTHKQKQSEQSSADETRIIEIDLPFEHAYNVAMNILQQLDSQKIPQANLFQSNQVLKIHKQDKHMGRIEAGLRAKTIGIRDVTDFTRITMQLQRLSDNVTRIQIEANTTNPLEAFDMGRHTHYVNFLAKGIRQASADEVSINDSVTRLSDEISSLVDNDMLDLTDDNPTQNKKM